MSKSSTDSLVRLIQTLTKAEKRSFKLYAKRNSSSLEELKFLQLFDFMDKTDQYSDELVTMKITSIKKAQLSNLKAHLYKQILTSLRLQHVNYSEAIEIREAIDFAVILYQKGLYIQALKVLDKAKQNAVKIQSTILQLEVLEFEKMIESQYITRSIENRAEELTQESAHLKERIKITIDHSNLSLQLYALYVKYGIARDEKDHLFVSDFFHSKLPKLDPKELGFVEKMHLYNAHVWFNYITQNFLMCFKYAKLWVDLFEEYEDTKRQFKEMYLKGLYNLQIALFHLRSYDRLKESLDVLERVDLGERDNDNVVLLHRLFYYLGKINAYYLCGDFKGGLNMVGEVVTFIEENKERLDHHRTMILYYKIACLYFGSGDYKMTIKYLTQIIQMKELSLREDIQCFARILNLIAHFELGKNDDLLEYQVKSVYRFLSNMNELHSVQREILSFLRQLPFSSEKEMFRSFRILHSNLVKLSQNPYEKRPFLYLDIISWLESKTEKRSVESIIQHKFQIEQKTGKSVYFP